jgi:hypothetical protein
MKSPDNIEVSFRLTRQIGGNGGLFDHHLTTKLDGWREQPIQLVCGYPLGTSHYMTVGIERHSSG